MSFSREKRLALLAGDLGVLTVSIPFSACVSDIGISRWKQTEEMREGHLDDSSSVGGVDKLNETQERGGEKQDQKKEHKSETD